MTMLLGVPYQDLGPPRRACSWDALDVEIARQRRLVAVRLMRSGWPRGDLAYLGTTTYAWSRFADGRWGWHGWNAGIPGGTWEHPDDYERAWAAGFRASPADALLGDIEEALDSWPGSSAPDLP